MIRDNKIEGNLGGAVLKKPRSSNLELYRILCMLLIVAHHYVVNSGLTTEGGPLQTDLSSLNSLFLVLFGAWGKTGINCFLMITGYFMCASQITVRKFLKLVLQVYLYKLLLFPIFLFTGYETLSFSRVVKLMMPFWGFSSDFVGCFMIFYLTLPFFSILVRNLSKRQHQMLLLLLLGCYTLFGSIPTFRVSFNYITWFGIIFFIASYIRLYPSSLFDKRKPWGWLTLLSLFFAVGSVTSFRLLFGGTVSQSYFFVADSNKILAILIALCSFLWFKNMNIKYSKFINAAGAATFGVLLIHANSDAMRIWLWKDTVDAVGHYYLPFGYLVLFSIGVVLAIFIICNIIDQLRIATIEKWFLNWYDNKLSVKADKYVNRIIHN